MKKKLKGNFLVQKLKKSFYFITVVSYFCKSILQLLDSKDQNWNTNYKLINYKIYNVLNLFTNVNLIFLTDIIRIIYVYQFCNFGIPKLQNWFTKITDNK
jgi:hypothetical protein